MLLPYALLSIGWLVCPVGWVGPLVGWFGPTQVVSDREGICFLFLGISFYKLVLYSTARLSAHTSAITISLPMFLGEPVIPRICVNVHLLEALKNSR